MGLNNAPDNQWVGDLRVSGGDVKKEGVPVGGGTLSIRVVDASDTLTTSDDVVFGDPTDGDVILTLPLASTVPGKVYYARLQTNTPNFLKLARQGDDRIKDLFTDDPGATQLTVTSVVQVISDGTFWRTLSVNPSLGV